MSLRLKLLLLGLATLVLPWAGCRYAREMESALRDGEVDSLQAVSQTIAASLQGRTDLLYREAPPHLNAESTEGGADAPPGGRRHSGPRTRMTSSAGPTIWSRSHSRPRRCWMATPMTGRTSPARGSRSPTMTPASSRS